LKQVLTGDGFLLGLQRMWRMGRPLALQKSNNAVFLMHGLLVVSICFCFIIIIIIILIIIIITIIIIIVLMLAASLSSS
jgi:hypothetical protein